MIDLLDAARAAVRVWVLAVCAIVVAGGGTTWAADDQGRGADPFVIVWLYDQDFQDSDFLAVVDVDPASRTYTEVVATLPTGMIGTMSHHTNYTYPPGGRLFANGYFSGTTFVLDVSNPLKPKLISSFGVTPAPYYNHPHSFAAAPGGHTLGAFQDNGPGKDGGLVEMDRTGRVLRSASAASGSAGEIVHPYSLDILPAIDRVITGNGDIMRGGPSNHVVQLWSLSGLRLLHTIKLDHGPRGVEASDPVEPRALADGKSAMVITNNCGLYLMRGLDGDDPSGLLVHDFGGIYCGVPLVIGEYWIQTVPSRHAIIALDVSDPVHPVEAGRFALEDGEFSPHWIAGSSDGSRILLSAGGGLAKGRLILFDFDPASGRIDLDGGFRDKGSAEVGIDFQARAAWPHGNTGPAISHGAVFWRQDISRQ